MGNDRAAGAGIQGGIQPWRDVFRQAPVSVLLATCFGVGFLPWVPGTWGSLVTIPLAALLYQTTGLVGLLVFAAAAAASGIVAAGRVARRRGVSDPSEVVIDEVAGQAIAVAGVYAFCPMRPSGLVSIAMVALAFVLFRILDVWKPGPIGALEKLPGGFGVMADDLLAGLVVAVAMAVLCLGLFRR